MKMKACVVPFHTILFVVCLFPSVSCAQRSIYETLWKAEEYFDDPQLVALCKAIEKEDISEIDRLVAAGADVNARGKDSMTPLLWAYPAGEKVLEHMLELGADPNTQYNSEFGSRGMVEKGDSLLFIAVKSTKPDNGKYAEKFKNYIDILLKHGADPNLRQSSLGMPPLWNTIRFKNSEAAEKLIKAGADVNAKDDMDRTLLSYAAGLKSYSVMHILLDHGADYSVIDRSNGLTVAHDLGSSYWLLEHDSETGKQYREVVAWLKKRGMSIERAKEQRDLWQSMLAKSDDPKGVVKKYIKEVSEPEIARWLPPGVEVPDDPGAVHPEKVDDVPALEKTPENSLFRILIFSLMCIVLLVIFFVIYYFCLRKKPEKAMPPE